MLVLSRKLHEKIVIDGNIVIQIVDIDRGKVRVGIEAPREISIWREELLRKENHEPQPAQARGGETARPEANP